MRRVTSIVSPMLALSLGIVTTAGCGAVGPLSASKGSPTATVNLTPTVQVIGSAQFPRYVKVDATPDVPGTNETIYEQYWQEQDPAYLKTLVSFLTYTDQYGHGVKGGYMGLVGLCNSCRVQEQPTHDVTVANLAYFFGPLLATEVVDDNLYVEIGMMKSDGTAIRDGSGMPLTQTFYVESFRSNKEPPITLVIASESDLSGAGGGNSIPVDDTDADLFAEYLNDSSFR